MRKFLLAALLVISLSASAQAGILSSIVLPGPINTMEDDSRGNIVNIDSSVAPPPGGIPVGNETFTIGDVVYGAVRINQRSGPTSSPSLDDSKQLIAVYSLQLKAFGATAGFPPFIPSLPVAVFGNTPDAGATAPYSLKSLLADALEPAGVDWTKAAVVILERTFAADSAANNPVTNTTDPGLDIIKTVMGTSAAVPALAGGWAVDMVLGFTGAADFYNVTLTNILGIDITALRADDAITPYGEIRGGLSVQYSNLGLPLLPDVDVVNQDVVANPLAATSFHQVTITGNTYSQNSTNWDFRDNADFRIHPVPEPGSLIVWSLVAGGIGMLRLRRRS
jgi:hypothetical protein